jgi:hypothetical protein
VCAGQANAFAAARNEYMFVAQVQFHGLKEKKWLNSARLI